MNPNQYTPPILWHRFARLQLPVLCFILHVLSLLAFAGLYLLTESLLSSFVAAATMVVMLWGALAVWAPDDAPLRTYGWSDE